MHRSLRLGRSLRLATGCFPSLNLAGRLEAASWPGTTVTLAGSTHWLFRRSIEDADLVLDWYDTRRNT